MREILDAIKKLHDAIIASGEINGITLCVEGNDLEYRIVKKGDANEKDK